MYRVELKVVNFVNKVTSYLPFLMYRVELKAKYKGNSGFSLIVPNTSGEKLTP